MYHLKLDIRLTLKTAFHTTGNRQVWLADKALAKSHDNWYIIPATSLKGFLRANAEVILKSPDCIGPQPDTMCYNSSKLCLVCQIFGNPRGQSFMKFRDAQLDTQKVEAQIRSGVGISRQRRAAYEQNLFFIETLQSGKAEFCSVCEGYFPNQDIAEKTIGLIYLAAHYGHAIGAARSRGLGWINEWQIKATINGENISAHDLAQAWQKEATA